MCDTSYPKLVTSPLGPFTYLGIGARASTQPPLSH